MFDVMSEPERPRASVEPRPDLKTAGMRLQFCNGVDQRHREWPETRQVVTGNIVLVCYALIVCCSEASQTAHGRTAQGHSSAQLSSGRAQGELVAPPRSPRSQ